MLVRLLMFSIFATLTAVAAELYFGSIIFASAENELQEIVLRDVYREEMHELSGMVIVPTDCYDISIRTRDVTARVTAIIFETWEQPSVVCEKVPTPRAVRASVFGDKELQFRALLDGEWVPLRVVAAL